MKNISYIGGPLVVNDVDALASQDSAPNFAAANEESIVATISAADGKQQQLQQSQKYINDNLIVIVIAW